MLGLTYSAGGVGHHGTVLLSTSDNLSSVCAYEKGRAADFGLLSHCRVAAALQLATQIRWKQRHVEGLRNVADHMSRAADRGWLSPGRVWRFPAAVLTDAEPSKNKKPSAGPVGQQSHRIGIQFLPLRGWSRLRASGRSDPEATVDRSSHLPVEELTRRTLHRCRPKCLALLSLLGHLVPTRRWASTRATESSSSKFSRAVGG